MTDSISRLARRLAWGALALCHLPGAAAAQTAPQAPLDPSDPAQWQVPPTELQALRFRELGPFRGGRVTTVTGVRSKPHTFYFGATGGGVWKTESAGQA